MSKDEAIEKLRSFAEDVRDNCNKGEYDNYGIAVDVLAMTATIEAPISEAVAWSYECRQPHTDPVIWSEFIGRLKPKAGEWVRNISPLFAAPVLAAVGVEKPQQGDPAPTDAGITVADDAFGFALMKHLGPDALTGGKMTPYRAFELGWQARGQQQAGVPDEVAGVDIKRLLRNLDDTSYNEGSEALACRLSDCRAVIKELLTVPGEA